MKNENGFTLIEVMIVAAIIGGLSVVFMQIMMNVQKGHNRLKTNSDLIELRSSIRMILDNEKFCTASLARKNTENAPLKDKDGINLPAVKFNKSEIDFNGKNARDYPYDPDVDKGMDVELWLSNHDGTAQARKELNGSDNPGTNDRSKFGSLEIKTLRLIINAQAGDYPDDTVFIGDSAQIVAMINKEVGSKNDKMLVKEVFNISVSGVTGNSGTKKSELSSCYRSRLLSFTPSNSYWTDWSDPTHEAAPGEFVCGVQYRPNCDFYGSDNGCLRVKFCSP